MPGLLVDKDDVTRDLAKVQAACLVMKRHFVNKLRMFRPVFSFSPFSRGFHDNRNLLTYLHIQEQFHCPST